MVEGDRRPYLVAIIVPEEDKTSKLDDAEIHDCESTPERPAHPTFRRTIFCIGSINKKRNAR